MSTRIKIWMLLLSVLLVAGLPLSRILAADGEARLLPTYQNIGVGQVTTVSLRVENVQDLYGYQTAIVFNPAVLEVIDADPGETGVQVELGTFLQPDFVQQNNADNSVGAIICVVSQLAPTGAVSGSGDLLSISFRGKAQGISDVYFTDLRLARVDGMEISVTRQDAQVGVGSVTPPTTTPTATTTPTPTPTSTVPTPTPTPTTVGPTATPTPTLSPGQPIIYVVHTGDTLYSIARRFGVSLQALMQINCIVNPNYIQVGQRLIIPRDTSITVTPPPPLPTPPIPSPIVYIVQRGDTLYSIARRYGTTVQAIALANRIVNPSRIYVGQRLIIYSHITVPPAPPWSRVHVVQHGETLYSIARCYGTTVWTLAMVNHLYNPNVIYAGQRLLIP